jgi:hypothetical protein
MLPRHVQFGYCCLQDSFLDERFILDTRIGVGQPTTDISSAN